MNRSRNIESGFTLIEMLAVLAIITVITGIVIFNVGTERQNSALLRSAQNLSLNLRRAQAYALSSKKFMTDIDVPWGWGVHFFGAGSTNYVIFADRDNNKIRTDSSEDLETVNFENGISLGSSNINDVVFAPPEPTTVFTPNQTVASVVLINKNSVTRVITINKTGFISSP